MPTTFANLVPVRRVAVGDCSGPLGSGFDALARSAYTALRAAEWTESADPPFLPVHDNGQTANTTIPRGDAWKCSYGYDAAARTERSACGAVCYSFALPADATSGTPANITTVALSLTGDRYLDAGVDLYLVPSASPTPPSVTDLLALTPVGTYCATSDQSPTPPNERHGVTEAVSAALDVAAQPYIHVALLLHDYTTNRGAWIEGGAMLEGAAATITFSRDVAADTPPDVLMLSVNGTTNETPPYTQNLRYTAYSFLGLNYPSFTPNVPTTAFATESLRLAYGGLLVDAKAERSFSKNTIRSMGSIHLLGTFSGPGSILELFMTAFYASPTKEGMRISVGKARNRGNAAGEFRVALVQHSSIANVGDSMIACSLGDIPPVDQVAAGYGPDIIAMSQDISIAGAEGSNYPESGEIVLSVVRTPDKPYVSLVVFPTTSSEIQSPSDDSIIIVEFTARHGYLVASMPTD